MPTLPLRVVGALCLALALSHLGYPRRFGWHEDLARVKPFTRQVFWVHTLFVVLVLVEQGLLLVLRPELLASPSPLGAALCGGMAFFWALRLYAQWGLYDRALWVGKPFETRVHWAFTGVWALFTGVYVWGLAFQLAGTA